jgi:hypothetical protein
VLCLSMAMEEQVPSGYRNLRYIYHIRRIMFELPLTYDTHLQNRWCERRYRKK